MIMISQTLRDARRYEDAMAQNITPLERPEFHLSPKVGWMNDPNGFSYYKDKFHLFYQYYPYDSQWGPMHWGHAVSDDLLHWEYLPAAIAPDMPYDYVGCFSGSAITLPDGKQLFMYTSVRKEAQPDGGVRKFFNPFVTFVKPFLPDYFSSNTYNVFFNGQFKRFRLFLHHTFSLDPSIEKIPCKFRSQLWYRLIKIFL